MHTYADIMNSNSKWIDLQEEKKNHKITKMTNKLRRKPHKQVP